MPPSEALNLLTGGEDVCDHHGDLRHVLVSLPSLLHLLLLLSGHPKAALHQVTSSSIGYTNKDETMWGVGWTATPEAGSYEDGGKVAQKPTFWKAGFSPK